MMDIRQQKIDLDFVRQQLRKQYIRATTASADDVDLLAIDLFASMVQQNESVITLDATKIISEKFKSANMDEVLLALNVLEECMSKCGSKFHNEIGKFRFLNELTRLVSPDLQGNTTPKKIRDKIMDLLLLWTINYPNEKKIKEAYEMLLKHGVKHEFVKTVTIQNKNGESSAPKCTAARPDGMDKLKSLVHSDKPCDHKAANLLIQNMVKEKERRNEVKIRRELELKEMFENGNLLNEMLDQIAEAKNNGINELTEDVLATLKDLYDSCKRVQPTILILLGDLNVNELLDDAFQANDLYTEVSNKYNQLVLNKTLISSNNLMYSNSLKTNRSTKNTMDELSEIFTTKANNSTNNSIMLSNALNSKLLEPMPAATLSSTQDSNDKAWQSIKDLNNASTTNHLINITQSIPSTSALASPVGIFDKKIEKDLDVEPFSKPIIAMPKEITNQQSKLMNFDSEITELITGLKLNMRKESTETSPNENESDGNDILAIDQDSDDELFDGNEMKPKDCPCTNHDPVDTIENAAVNVNKPLSEVIIDLNTVRPHEKYPSRCILDESTGLKIILNFTKDRPRDDIVVLVITTINQNCLPIQNYQLEASVSRPCKLHLQKTSGHQLPGCKPFRPPTEDITQILLLSNPERKPVKLVCIISYILGNDPDPVKEFLEITDLPDLFE